MPHVCSKCGLPEGEVEFAVEKGRKGKLYKRLDCRGCRKAYLKAYYHSNKVAGLTVPTIHYHRKRLGIPSYRAQRKHVEAS
jgi:hypothetical protein